MGLEVGKVNLQQSPSIAQKANTSGLQTPSTVQKEDIFNPSKQQLPDGKAISVKKKFNPLNLLLLTLGIISYSSTLKYELVDFDASNISEKEQKQIRQGKLINEIPYGYKIADGNIEKI